MSEWNSVKFETLASPERSSFSMGPFGSKVTQRDYVDDGVPLTRGINLTKGVFHDDDFVYITPTKADEVSSAYVVAGDLIFTHRGTIGQVSMIPRKSRYDRYVVCSSQVKARLNSALAVPEFYYYWFRSPVGQHSILSHTSTVGVPGIATPLTTIRQLSVPHPELWEQKAIASVLGVLDDKIAVNHQIAVTARSLIMAKFSQSLTSPGARSVELSSLTSDLVRGITPKYADNPDSLVVINQKCIRNGRVNLDPARKTAREKVKPPKLLKKDDVLVNSTGVGTLGRVARWTASIEATVDSHVTIVRFDPVKVDPVCAGLALIAIQSDIEMLGEGSTGQTELSRARLGSCPILLPSDEATHSLRSEVDLLESRGDRALAESVYLSELRDALLPKLMSGDIRVRDAEKVVEDAV
jgi:type I restriction enzyme S subunit